MSVKLGQTSIGAIYLGSTKIGQAYLGSTKVYDSTPAEPTFVATVPPSRSTSDSPMAWPVFNGDMPTSVVVSFRTNSIAYIRVEFNTVDTDTSATTTYGYYDYSTSSGSSNVQHTAYVASDGFEYHKLQLDVSSIASDLSSGAKTLEYVLIPIQYTSISVKAYDASNCGYWK